MKKLLCVLLLIVMLLPVVVACAPQTDPTPSGKTGEEVSTGKPADVQTQPATDASAPVTGEPTGETLPTVEPSTKEETPTEVPTVPTETPTETPTDPTGETTAPTTVTVEPTETPVPDYEPVEGKIPTEEDLGVLPVGSYRIKSKTTGQYISFAAADKNFRRDIAATLDGENNALMIVYQTCDAHPYYLIFAGSDNMHLLTTPVEGENTNDSARNHITDNSELVFRGKYYKSGNNDHYDDKFPVMQWELIKNEDGSFSFLNRNNEDGKNRYLAISGDDLIVAATEESVGGIQSFDLELVERGGCESFKQFISENGKVTVRVATNIARTKLTDDQLQLWANNLGLAYMGYWELTSYRAHHHIVVKAYEPAYVPGYVWNTANPYYNVITLNRDFMTGDLQKMYARSTQGVIDWNFCALHEMGHMFDNQQPWYFEAEMMTDFKVAYVLQRYGGCASPSEHPRGEYFYADHIPGHPQIEECYLARSDKQMPISKSLVYGAYGAALKFVEIQRLIDDDNWTVMKQVYKELHERGLQTWDRGIMFKDLISKMSEVSGVNVRAFFTDVEWNVFLVQTYDDYGVWLTNAEGRRAAAVTQNVKVGDTLPGIAGTYKGTLTYTSSAPEVAQVDERGNVTILSAGKAVITVREEQGAEAILTLNARN